MYNSITDFADFVDDVIRTVEAAQRQDVSADPNQTVQSFIDLCARHEDNFYKFVHEVHIHDNGLFNQLMGWLEGILEFLRHGPSGGKLDMNALFQGGMDLGMIKRDVAIREINSLIRWQTARKKWHQDKTRQKMASGGGDESGADALAGLGGFRSSDFGLHEVTAHCSFISTSQSRGHTYLDKPTDSKFPQADLQDLDLGDDDSAEGDSSADSLNDDDVADPIGAERRRRAKKQDALRRSAGEPQKPEIVELRKLDDTFVSMLRSVLAA